MLITTMRFKVSIGMRRVTHWDGYDKVDAPGRDDKEGMCQAADNELDTPGRRQGGCIRPRRRSQTRQVVEEK